MTSGADLGGPLPDEIPSADIGPEVSPEVSEVRAAVVACAGRLHAAGASLAGVLLGTLAATADGAARLPADEYDALMTSVAAWVIEAYADERDGGTTALPRPRST